jgi:hypothetical protein
MFSEWTWCNPENSGKFTSGKTPRIRIHTKSLTSDIISMSPKQGSRNPRLLDLPRLGGRSTLAFGDCHLWSLRTSTLPGAAVMGDQCSSVDIGSAFGDFPTAQRKRCLPVLFSWVLVLFNNIVQIFWMARGFL